MAYDLKGYAADQALTYVVTGSAGQIINVPFPAFAESDFRVYLGESILALNTDYTVAFNSTDRPSLAMITITAAHTQGDDAFRVTLENLPGQRETEYNARTYEGKVVNEGFDRSNFVAAVLAVHSGGGGGAGVDEIARQAAADAQATANQANTLASASFNAVQIGDVGTDGRQQITLIRGNGASIPIFVGPFSTTGGTANAFTAVRLDTTANIAYFTIGDGPSEAQLDLTPFVNQTAAQIANALFTLDSTTALTNFEDRPMPITEGSFQTEGGGSVSVTIGTLTLDQHNRAKANTETFRVTGTITWDIGEHSGVEPSAEFELLYGGQRLGGFSLQGGAEQNFDFDLTQAAANAAANRGFLVEVQARTRGGAAPDSVISVSGALLHSPGPGYEATVAISDATFSRRIRAVNETIAANTTKNAEQDTEITALQHRTSFTPSEAALDLLRRALEVHMNGNPTYPAPPFIAPVTRWQVGTGTSLDDDGVTINTDQRRALYGLGSQNDKAYFVKTVSANTSSSGHLIYRVTPGGSDEPIFATDVVNGTRVWQALSLDSNDTPLIRNLVTADLINGVPYQAGDGIGWIWETFESGAVRLVPVIYRADGTTKLQCNDIDFGTGAVANLNPDRLAIATGTHISDVWVAKHSGIGVRHNELAQADFREAGLGLRVEGAGRDILTLSGDIEWTGNKFIVKEGALMIRKADGTTEVFTQGGEIPTATIEAVIATYLADNPISPTQATVVRRDYDSTILGTAAAASLGGNTGLWVVANQQTGTGGIPTANVSAGTGVTLPDAVNGIVNLPPGTLCRIRSGTDILVLFIPIEEVTTDRLADGAVTNPKLAAAVRTDIASRIITPDNFTENDMLVMGASAITRRPVPLVARGRAFTGVAPFAETPTAELQHHIAIGHEANISSSSGDPTRFTQFAIRIGRSPQAPSNTPALDILGTAPDNFATIAIGDVPYAGGRQSIAIGDLARAVSQKEISIGTAMNAVHLSLFASQTGFGVLHSSANVAAGDFLENTGGTTRGRFAPSYYDAGTFITAPNGVWLLQEANSVKSWTNVLVGGSGATNLGDLEDVTITDPKSGDVLTRDENGNWVNQAPTSGGGGTPAAATPEVVLEAYSGNLERAAGFVALTNAIDLTQQWDEMNVTADQAPITNTTSTLLPSISMSAVKRDWKAVSGLSGGRTHQVSVSALGYEPDTSDGAAVSIIVALKFEGTADSITHMNYSGDSRSRLLNIEVVRWAQGGSEGAQGAEGKRTVFIWQDALTSTTPTGGSYSSDGVLTVPDAAWDLTPPTIPDGSNRGLWFSTATIDPSADTPEGRVGPWSTPVNIRGPAGSGSAGANAYYIDAWIEVPKSVETVSSSALTSAGTWNNSASAPAFTTKPTTSVASGNVLDASDLPANSTTSTTRNYHHFKRIFTVGETGVQASAWDYMGQWNHESGSTRRYLIHAYLRIQAGDVPTTTALTSGGIWSDQAQKFTTKPTENVLDGMVYDDSDLPSDAATSTQYDYWEYVRYWTEGEGTIAGTAWRRIKKIDQDPATGGGGASLTWTPVTITAGSAPITLSSTQLMGMTELAVAYGTSTTIGGGTDSHGTSDGNAAKVWGTNIALAIIPPYSATNAFMQFGGFGRGAQQYVVQVKRTDTGGLLIEAIDSNDGTNDNILSIHAR